MTGNNIINIYCCYHYPNFTNGELRLIKVSKYPKPLQLVNDKDRIQPQVCLNINVFFLLHHYYLQLLATVLSLTASDQLFLISEVLSYTISLNIISTVWESEAQREVPWPKSQSKLVEFKSSDSQSITLSIIWCCLGKYSQTWISFLPHVLHST